MTGLVASVALKTAFARIGSGVSGAFSWVVASSTHLLTAALGLSLLWGAYGHHEADKWEKAANSSEAAFEAEHVGRLADRKSYADAQVQAQKDEQARLARVQTAQQEITANVSNSYDQQLSDLRARYDGLRKSAQALAIVNGTSGGQSVPTLPNAPQGTDGQASGDGLLAVLQAADEQTLRLRKLQDWVSRQTGVPVN